MAFFDDLLERIGDGAAGLAKDDLQSLLGEAKADATAFVTESKDALLRWTKLLGDGAITRREFADLVSARTALAQMVALTQAGIALTRLDRFKAGLAQLVVSSVFSLIPV